MHSPACLFELLGLVMHLVGAASKPRSCRFLLMLVFASFDAVCARMQLHMHAEGACMHIAWWQGGCTTVTDTHSRPLP